ncbi:MAG TPA: uroporphyrinogen decarboxylase family protein [Phycisphaerae bacterium]|nr:uroporphyrinogen decarboxylase family protein [Phycisphaerae bacterium]
MMTRRQRLMATLRGETVDRPAVNFYEIGGFGIDPADTDPFNVYTDPSWRPLIDLAEAETDLVRMVSPAMRPAAGNPRGEFFAEETWTERGSRFTRTTLRVAGRTMTALARRDPDVNTWWQIEHLLKTLDDLRAYLELPDAVFASEPDTSNLEAAERDVGDRGIVMVDCGDPLCAAAPLFAMADYLVVAFTEPRLFHRLLEKHARPIHATTERVARAFPGRLWRICGPEYATEPYLPPRLFREYVVPYTGPMVEAIHRHGGFARVHCHGRLRSALPHIMTMGPAAIDPVEPPPQGDVRLADVRREFGRDLVLFGNIESSEIANTRSAAFERRVAQALRDGTAGRGRGFVLMPSACPVGRKVTAREMANYRTMVRLATTFGG